MQFQSKEQQACYEKILPWMTDLFGPFLRVRDEIPSFGVIVGAANIQLAVLAWGERDALITTRCYVVTNIKMTSGLMEYLLHENNRMIFGAFGVDEDGDIFVQHTIIGTSVDKEELKTSIYGVVHTADAYDEAIQQRWGGESVINRS